MSQVDLDPKDALIINQNQQNTPPIAQQFGTLAETLKHINYLEQNNADLKSFTHIASKNIKYPLRNIQTYLQLLERKCKSKMEAEDMQYFVLMNECMTQINKVLEGVVTYARIEKNNSDSKVIEFSDIKFLLYRNNEAFYTEKNATIVWNNMPDSLIGNLSNFVKIFQYIIENAIKHNKSANPLVEIDCALDATERYLFSIKDNGIGIEKVHQTSIFDMQERLQKMPTNQSASLGLILCHRLVKSYGGDIWLSSVLGEGSTFFFTLPTRNNLSI